MDLFRTRSYEEIHLKEVASRAGISRELIYHYFPSKEALLVAAVEEKVLELLAPIDGIDPSLPLADAILLGLGIYLDFVESHSQMYLNLFQGPAAAVPELVQLCEQTRAVLGDKFLSPLVDGSQMELPATRLFVAGAQGFIERGGQAWLQSRGVPRRDLEMMFALQLGDALETGLLVDLPQGHLLRDEIEAQALLFRQAVHDHGSAPN